MNPAVASGDDVIRIGRIDPQRVEISVDFLHASRSKSFAAVLGEKHRRAQNPNPQIIIRINAHLAVIRRPWIGVAHLLPRFALIFAAENAAFFMLHECVHDIGIFPVDIKSNASGFAAVFVR